MQLDIALLIALYSILAVIGLIGNCWVLVTVGNQLFACNGKSKKATLHSSAYIYLILLSIVDLFSLLAVPMVVGDMYSERFNFGNFLCRLIYICEGANKTLSPMVLTALSIDRYIAICQPKLVWMRETPFALFVIATSLVASSVLTMPFAMTAQVQNMKNAKNECVEKCSMFSKPIFDLLHVILCYFVPLILIIAVYLAILGKLYRHTRYSTVGRKTSISLSRVLKCSVMVVAFYFFCWTPYWCLRIHVLVLDYFPRSIPGDANDTMIEAPVIDFEDGSCLKNDTMPAIVNERPNLPPPKQFDQIFWMCFLHAFPYAQSAFNWLFYAFLNRNLRNSAGRNSHVIRSAQVTSTILDNGNSTLHGRSPLWKNLQTVGTQIKSAGIDTGHALLRLSPFRTRSAAQSRSSICLDSTFSDKLLPPPPTLSSSMTDIQRKSSTLRPDIIPKTLSYSELPQKLIEPHENSKVSESSSIEWL